MKTNELHVTQASEISDDVKYGREALKKGLPWIVPASLTFLEQRGMADFNVFEWGSGGSTVYYAREAKSVIAVEHNSDWVMRTGKLLAKRALRATILYVRRGPEDKFRDYANVINYYPDESFDIIQVDGEASSRGWCLTNAIPKLKPGGFLVLDNSDWLKRDLGDSWERWDFVVKGLTWIGQKGTFNWWTSILRKNET